MTYNCNLSYKFPRQIRFIFCMYTILSDPRVVYETFYNSDVINGETNLILSKNKQKSKVEQSVEFN